MSLNFSVLCCKKDLLYKYGILLSFKSVLIICFLFVNIFKCICMYFSVKYIDNEETINVQSLIQAQLRFCHGCRMPVRLGAGINMKRRDVDKVR